MPNPPRAAFAGSLRTFLLLANAIHGRFSTAIFHIEGTSLTWSYTARRALCDARSRRSHGKCYARTAVWPQRNGPFPCPSPRFRVTMPLLRQRLDGASRRSRRQASRTDGGSGAGLCAGQPRHSAESARRRFQALLRAQSEALSADRHVGTRRLARAGTRRGSRHSHRSAALSGLAQRRTGRRAGRHSRLLARRSGELRHRLLVFIRGSADGGRASSCATSTCGCNVPMYRTSVATAAAGPFHGPLVVSMRPMTPANAKRAVAITGRFPTVHGAPVQVGHPE